jgi:hypothetical protein
MLKRKTFSKRPESLQAQQARKAMHQYTSKIEFLGRGKSENGDSYLKVRVDKESALLNVDNLADARSGELKILTRLGEPLLASSARNKFLAEAQEEARKPPTFAVVTKTGWRDDVFVLPGGAVPNGQSDIELYFDPRYAHYHEKLREAGTPAGWRELARLCRGKTRLMGALALSFTGPICAAFGLEPPGLHLVAEGGKGKTTIGRVAAATWGGDPNPVNRLGCGVSWNTTTDDLEVVAAAFNQMLLFLDDMHDAGTEAVKAIVRIMNGEGKGRWTEVHRQTFCTPLLSTSNTSVIAIAKALGLKKQYEALIDRLIDISLPDDCRYFFEGLQEKEEFRAFGNGLRRLCSKNFGLAGPEFVRRLAIDLKADRARSQAFVEARQQSFWNAAANIESRGDRDLTRLCDRFATIYDAGCLAISYNILPFAEAELLDALLVRLRDHVAFIDNELGIAAAPANFSGAVRAPAATIAPAQQPFDQLKKFINAGGFLDLREEDPSLPLAEEPIGYVGEHDKRKEYWLTNRQFEAVAGGKREGQVLKVHLHSMGLLSTVQRGAGLGLVVKRPIPGANNRTRVVAIRAAPQKQARPLEAQRQSASR